MMSFMQVKILWLELTAPHFKTCQQPSEQSTHMENSTRLASSYLSTKHESLIHFQAQGSPDAAERIQT